MQNRIVEISSEGAHLSVKRGFLSINIAGDNVGQVAIDDMSALIIRGHGASLSVNICTRLASANIPIVICGSNQAPASIIWPISGHYAQGLHMQAQAEANKPLRKRLWTQIVKSKIMAQAEILAATSHDHNDLRSMAKRVKSGDPDNLEAQAARRYWPRLMGDQFKRDRDADGINAALNYGYTVIRAATARAILAAGLHPSLSIQHQSRGEALRLADDLMEPFRPWVDYAVYGIANRLSQNTPLLLGPEVKKQLASILTLDLMGPMGASPMQTCMYRLAQSLAQIFIGDRSALELPGRPLPLTLKSFGD